MSAHIPLPPVLSTDRLELRMVTPEHMQYLFTRCTDDEIMQSLYLPSADALAAEKQRFARGRTMYDVSFRFFLLSHKETGLFIGKCGFHTWRPSHSRSELGYAIASNEQMGKGYMTEALRAVVVHGFEEMSLHRIEAMTGTQNIASQKLLSRLGFTKEGTLREHYNFNGKMEDSMVFSLLRRDYLKM